ncbi:MAG TPA: DUF6600 domain-containing protein, partial [Dongiaceae bacterium]|nr:DUF6600 domain-containing protein [Dongiaceae bacterium]
TWVSDYPWGAIPYHYGTWYPDPVFGWVWVPGDVWAPAWVVFRTGPDYIGWAPVSPRFAIGVSFAHAAPAGPFLFVPAGHFCDVAVGRHAVSESRGRALVHETRLVDNLAIRDNLVVNRGPDPAVIERAGGRPIRRVPIEAVPRAAPGGVHDRSRIAVASGHGQGAVAVSRPIRDSRTPVTQDRRITGLDPRQNHGAAAPPARQAQRPPAPPSSHRYDKPAPPSSHGYGNPVPPSSGGYGRPAPPSSGAHGKSAPHDQHAPQGNPTSHGKPGNPHGKPSGSGKPHA